MIALVALAIWILVLVFGWAVRPIDDTVPIVVDPASALAAEIAVNPATEPSDAPRAQLVVCHSLFHATARDSSEPLPALRADYVYSRPACTNAHTGAQVALVANALAIMAAVGAWIWVSRRSGVTPPSRPERSSAGASSVH